MSGWPRKRFGQHFLHDPAVIGRLIAAIAPAADDCMVEIGGGRGALTRPLLDRVRTLHVIELDTRLADRLASIAGQSANAVDRPANAAGADRRADGKRHTAGADWPASGTDRLPGGADRRAGRHADRRTDGKRHTAGADWPASGTDRFPGGADRRAGRHADRRTDGKRHTAGADWPASGTDRFPGGADRRTDGKRHTAGADWPASGTDRFPGGADRPEDAATAYPPAAGVNRFAGAASRPGRLVVHPADALEFDFSSLASAPGTLRVVGNLPYNISTPLLFRLLNHRAAIADMHLMLQREVAERLAAAPGSKTYGRLTAMLAPWMSVETCFPVGPGAFQPAPKVWSSVVRLTPRRPPLLRMQDPQRYAEVVRRLFSMRRKTLAGSLRPWLTRDQIAAAGIDPGLRPERLAPMAFERLARAWASAAGERDAGAMAPAAPSAEHES